MHHLGPLLAGPRVNHQRAEERTMATIENILAQVDGGTRYLVRTPRGHVGVTVAADGALWVTPCTDATRTTLRDLQVARRLVKQALAEEGKGEDALPPRT